MTDDTGVADDTDAAAQWVDARTTFQRVYDTVLGTTDHVPAGTVAERAQCSETAAREALTQLVEMGVATDDRRRTAETTRISPGSVSSGWRQRRTWGRSGRSWRA